MEAAALLAAGWAVQAAASCPVIPPTAPAMTATSRSSTRGGGGDGDGGRAALGGRVRHQGRLLQELPALAGSMSQTSPAGAVAG